MARDARIISSLGVRRRRAGLTQRALAGRVGVSRQAVHAIEAGTQVPSTGLALELARVLGCAVEDLFALAGGEELAARWPPERPGATSSARVLLGRVEGAWAAHPLDPDDGLAADGVVVSGDAARVVVRPLVDADALERRVLVAGCAPLLGLLSAHTARRFPDARASWIPADSRRALDLLAAGLVHVAGLHLGDARSGDVHARIVRARFPGRAMWIVHLTRWRQGLVVARGNPLGVHGVADLVHRGARIARRPPGAGAAVLYDRLRAEAGDLGGASDRGGPTVGSHADVARLVRFGAVDAGVALEASAAAAGLDFIPLVEERFDLVVPADRATRPPVARLLDVVRSSAFRAEARLFPGCDVGGSGDVAAVSPA